MAPRNYNDISLNQRVKGRKLYAGIAAEFLATCIFVFNVVGSTLSWPFGSTSVLHIALTVGVSIAVLAASIGHLTGGHINPVVTLSFITTKRVHPIDGVLYIFAQFSGGIAGAAILYVLTPVTIRRSFGVTIPSPQLHVGQAVGIEAILTFLLVFTIHSVTDSKRPSLSYIAPVIIGLCVFVCHMVGIPFTGCSMNPARSLGPAVMTNTWSDHWVYWIGPILGALIAGLCYEAIFTAKKNTQIVPNETAHRSQDEL